MNHDLIVEIAGQNVASAFDTWGGGSEDARLTHLEKYETNAMDTAVGRGVDPLQTRVEFWNQVVELDRRR